jgi:hypothetical protein
MVTILQKVTTFPIEMLDLQPNNEPFLSVSGDDVHKYYTNPIPNLNNGPITDEQMKQMLINPDKKNTPQNIRIKQRFIVFNALYNKLFENSLNMLEKTKQRTVIVFPTHDTSNKGLVELNSKVIKYYNKFDKILEKPFFEETSQAQSQSQSQSNVCYIEISVFNNDKKDEYKKNIKSQFDNLRKSILDFNTNISRQQAYKSIQPIQSVIFILDVDKKGLFTGMYNKQLSQEKKDILNKEYTSFLSNQGFSTKGITDSGINITYSDIVKQVKSFQQFTGLTIGKDIIPKETFEEHIILLKEGYKKITDKEYKKTLELQDNIEKFRIFYKINNADKVLEDKIETGSNKLYYMYYDNVGVQVKGVTKYAHVIGYFTLISEERRIYRFREDTSWFNQRKSAESTSATIADEENPLIEDDEESDEDEEMNKEAFDFAVKVQETFGTFYYENLKKDKKNKIYDKVRTGEIIKFIDKTEENYKWFNLRDIDSSFLDKDSIKFYSDILFDKETLIEYLKSKKKYNDKTMLSYEFLKINDGPELSEYCDFIHNKFPSNIKEDTYNPFSGSFNDDKIINNIINIIFDSNTQIYLRASKVTKEEARKESRDSYKIVDYTIVDSSFDDESCMSREKNKCKDEYAKKKDLPNRIINIVVTKANIKDVGVLKSKTDCKIKKDKLIYDYKKLFNKTLIANFTRRIVTGQYYGGRTYKSKMNKSRKRRLKAKRYK